MLAHIVLLVSLAGNSAPGHDPSKGVSLFRGCQAEMRLMALGALEEAPPIDLINGAYCIGYLNGFTAGLPPESLSVCTRADSMGGMVRAYVSYMERNPALLEEDKRVGLRRALEAAYPCPAAP